MKEINCYVRVFEDFFGGVMCSRDDEDTAVALARLRTNQERLRLKRVVARKGMQVLTYASNGRRYFRQRFVKFFGGLPSHTNEVILASGTRVRFTELSPEVKEKFKLRSEKPTARIIFENEQIGFSFGKTGKKTYFPLQGKDVVRFEVCSIPRQK